MRKGRKKFKRSGKRALHLCASATSCQRTPTPGSAKCMMPAAVSDECRERRTDDAARYAFEPPQKKTRGNMTSCAKVTKKKKKEGRKKETLNRSQFLPRCQLGHSGFWPMPSMRKSRMGLGMGAGLCGTIVAKSCRTWAVLVRTLPYAADGDGCYNSASALGGGRRRHCAILWTERQWLPSELSLFPYVGMISVSEAKP